MNLEEEKENFAEVLENIPEIAMSSPSFPIELAEDITEIPFMPSDSLKKSECYCEQDEEEAPALKCSCCGNYSHLSCYHLNEKLQDNQDFICLSCQQKARNKILEPLIQSVTGIEEKLSKISESLEKIAPNTASNLPDVFGSIQNPLSCKDLCDSLHQIVILSQKVWKDVNKDIDEISSFVDVDILEDPENE